MRGGVLSRPPEGVIAGDDVPIENQADEIEEMAVDRVVGLLKQRPGYREKPEDKLREDAKEILSEVH
jgi:hypothetical protein